MDDAGEFGPKKTPSVSALIQTNGYWFDPKTHAVNCFIAKSILYVYYYKYGCTIQLLGKMSGKSNSSPR